ncbi:hypothetical protein L6164_005088 [Bauhinia variegata]|uniref:Uncharacterized protein n=1 Tax=Bauhinia variegata TaxID=167791 RepID=A0ACB9PPC8_BAUVA|nr:hypothetical protein L6164_005088 [Bauhinia variegata]
MAVRPRPRPKQTPKCNSSCFHLITVTIRQTGPSTSQVLTILAGAGLSLLGTVLGLAVATPLFIIFSPVLVPATIALGLAVAGFSLPV